MILPGGGTETDLYTVHRRAVLWFLELDPAERADLDTAIAPLVDLPEEGWPTKGAIRLRQIEPDRPGVTYMLKLGPSLRVFIRPTPGGKPEVLAFVHQEMLDLFKERSSASESSAPLGVGKTS
jgi:hypothetical protein